MSRAASERSAGAQPYESRMPSRGGPSSVAPGADGPPCHGAAPTPCTEGMETEQERSRPAPTAPGLGPLRDRHRQRPAVEFTTRHVFGLAAGAGHGSRSGAGTVDVAEPLAESEIARGDRGGGFDTGNASGTPPCDRRPTSTPTGIRSSRSTPTHRRHVRSGARSPCTGVTRHGEPVGGAVQRSRRGTFTVRAKTRIDRTEFGVTAARGMTGRHLDVRPRRHVRTGHDEAEGGSRGREAERGERVRGRSGWPSRTGDGGAPLPYARR